jgi:hypothetical protein
MELVLDIMANLIDSQRRSLAGVLLTGGGRALSVLDPILMRTQESGVSEIRAKVDAAR